MGLDHGVAHQAHASALAFRLPFPSDGVGWLVRGPPKTLRPPKGTIILRTTTTVHTVPSREGFFLETIDPLSPPAIPLCRD